MILLDSDVVIEVLRERPAAMAWFKSVSLDEKIALPGFVLMEVAGGCRDRDELRRLLRWSEKCIVLWLPINLSQKALREYFGLTLRNAIGAIDMLIAHIALHHGVALYTFNKKHYSAVKGLRTIQPFRR